MAPIADEEVYVAEPTPQNQLPPPTDDTASRNVDLVYVDLDAALKKFGGRLLNADDVDFSDAIGRWRRKAYGPGQYVLEVREACSTTPETVEQRLNRLTYEVTELKQQIAQEDSSKSDTGVPTSALVAELEKEIQGVKLGAASGNVPSTTAKATESKPISADLKTSTLDSRLRRIELLVGSSTSASGNRSLVDHVTDLKFRCDTLNQSYIDELDSRLNKMLTKYEEVKKRGSALATPSSVDANPELAARIDELHKLLIKWDSACDTLPANLKRIQALDALHEQAQKFSTRLASLAGIKEAVDQQIAEEKRITAELQQTATEQLKTLVERLTSLQKTVATLEKA